MRALFEHTRTHTVADSIFTIVRCRMDMTSYDTSKRDIGVRAFGRDSGAVEAIYVFGTVAEATDITLTALLDGDGKVANSVMAYNEALGLDGTQQNRVMTNVAGVAPNLSGLSFVINGADDTEDWDGVWSYTASPAGVVIDEIESILGDYMGSGEALEGFSAARVVKGPEDLLVMSRAPSIIAAIADETEGVRMAGLFALDVYFSVLVGDRGMKNRGEDVYLNVMGYAGTVRSILGDEKITLNGITAETVISSVEGPTLIAGEGEPYLASKVNGVCKFPVLNSDA